MFQLCWALGNPPPPSPSPHPQSLTGDLHHPVFGLDHELLRGEVIDVQGHPPAVSGLADLGHPAAQLAAEGPAVGGRRGGRGHLLGHGAGQQAHVARPAGAAGPRVPVLGGAGQAERLVEETAALVPVPERVPAGGPQEGEGHTALGHLWPSTGWGWSLSIAGLYFPSA
uniref:Uncharacterized protein n=1 Tax=Ornithorhynchus anatinus TaxID=9258 RepID=A0A6I8N7V8_ORNAN